MTLKALIVDDEYPARQELRFMLDKFSNIEIVGEATSATEALALIRALDYQVLFLDINLPGMNGLELGAAIQELPRPPFVIFVTAYDEHALEAFDVNAVDYILKPIDEKRLKRAIDRVIRAEQERAALVPPQVIAAPEPSKGEPVGSTAIKINRIPAEKQGKTILVDTSEVFYAFTEQDYVYIKTFADKLLTRFTLKELEGRLGEGMFFRTHRCYIVNLQKVKEIVPFFNGTYNLILEDKDRSEVPVSRAQAKKLRKILGF
ncbi:two component transcriptional regulator, LytTR family [Desulfotomaculum nigrificans CO-1-SRB]|uniref:Stage 0 sporulation protein A homolog n=1 Tax=Desulfotomaculum nigrificans (strain DSM 14880 / VKM B-2319 / CO-1-SRB) TaxID=868595 RepID=F6B7C9_DESCC|nr:LytTR family DNA-binding domain-containing protein [Desulfotomaculum nigrificans]AEF93379.1 two component transcriptional regulator, LytTR family [Desulfotomaculum nigrificans CO-1-SRB]